MSAPRLPCRQYQRLDMALPRKRAAHHASMRRMRSHALMSMRAAVAGMSHVARLAALAAGHRP